MPGTIMQIITSKLYIVGRSSETYTQQQNKCEGNIRDLQYQLKQRRINTNAPDMIWYL